MTDVSHDDDVEEEDDILHESPINDKDILLAELR